MSKSRIAVAIVFLALTAYTFYGVSEAEAIPERRSLAEFPTVIGDWTCAQRERMEKSAERTLGVTDYLLCAYQRDNPAQLVHVYLGYHQRQVREGGSSYRETSIHTPKHCLPGSGWDIAGSGTMELDVPGLPGGKQQINRFLIAKGNNRQIVYYWYHSRGRVIHRDWRKVFYMAWDRATRGRTDGSLVRFTVPLPPNATEAEADAAFLDFASLVVPRLGEFIPE